MIERKLTHILEMCDKLKDETIHLKSLINYIGINVPQPTTKLRKNRNSEIFCQNCEQVISINSFEALQMERCPCCGLKIIECKFDI